MAVTIKYVRVLKANYPVPVLFYNSHPSNDELKADIAAIVPLIKPLSEAPVRSAYLSSPYKADNAMIYNSSTSKMTNEDIQTLTEGYVFEPAGDRLIGGLIGGIWAAAPEYYFGLPNTISNKAALRAFTVATEGESLSNLYPVIYAVSNGSVYFGAYRSDGTIPYSSSTAQVYNESGGIAGALWASDLETYLVLYDEPVFEEEPAEPDISHITTSSGDGFALYNGVKLLNIDSVWDKTKYPYALIAGFDETIVYFSTKPFYVDTNAELCLTEVGTICSYVNDTGWQDPETITGYPANEPIFNTDGDVIVWTSHDILNTDGSIYLAASEPIPLDGYTVIEWDGNTEGLDSFEESFTGTYYKVTNYVITKEQIENGSVILGQRFSGIRGGTTWETNYSVVFNADNYTELDDGMYAAVDWDEQVGIGIIPTAVGNASVGTYLWGASEYETVNYNNQVLAYKADSGGTTTYDRTAFLSGMAMGLTGKGDPISGMAVSGGGASGNMLYNGVELPKLPEWDETAYPYALVQYVDGTVIGLSGRIAILNCANVPFERNPGATDPVCIPSPYSIVQYYYATPEETATQLGINANEWVCVSEDTGTDGTTTFSYPLWTSHDILNEDGSVYLAASDPVPVGGSDSFVKGYLAGAALRRKRVIVETDVLIDTLPILWNSAEVTNNTKVTFGGMPFVRISNLYADDEGDVRTNAGSLLVTMGGMTITAPLVSVTAYNDNTIFMAGYNVNGEVIYALSIGADNVTFNGTTFPKRGVYVPDVYVIYGEAICEFKSAIENAHSYNGYILPGLPEWDKTAYPYAFIGVAGGSNNAGYVYHLHVSNTPFYGQLSDGLTLPNMPNGGTFKLCGVYEEGVSEDVLESIQTLYGYTPQSVYDGWSAWTAEKSSTVSTTLLAAPVWANHDLVYYSGNLAGKTWVEASEPVPV